MPKLFLSAIVAGLMSLFIAMTGVVLSAAASDRNDDSFKNHTPASVTYTSVITSVADHFASLSANAVHMRADVWRCSCWSARDADNGQSRSPDLPAQNQSGHDCLVDGPDEPDGYWADSSCPLAKFAPLMQSVRYGQIIHYSSHGGAHGSRAPPVL